jgi:polyribonucleotide nucleotidyltransferase
MKVAKISKTLLFGDHELKIESGEIARQATGSVIVSMNETVVLVTAVVKPDDGQARDFFPLTVNYMERSYASGRIPGGFLRREGRPSDSETLVSRLIDRPIRPLFDKKFKREVQVVATVLSLNPEVEADVLAMIGASAALALTGAPFGGPLAGVRVGYKDGIYLLNPTREVVSESSLDLIVAGTKNAVLMVESRANELSEEVMLGAVMYGHEMMQSVITAIEEMVTEAGVQPMPWQPPEAAPQELVASVKAHAEASVHEAYQIADKVERQNRLAAIREEMLNQLTNEDNKDELSPVLQSLLSDLEKQTVRSRVIAQEPRIDGRDHKTVRPITVDTGLLPRVHGSAIFTRGETQAIVTATLGSDRDAQIIDSVYGDARDRFMLHYNFPPYCVGETGFMSGPKRREIGHGKLAWRALQAVLPSDEDFPYVLRVVSEITESNGSSSMASVCGACLSMMDAGVPIKAPVAGIAMGLVKEGDKFAVLTDILGDEDHLGDMDFKVAGSEKGVTALQMDIKIDGITKEIMEQALAQAREGRMHILGIMNQSLSAPRQEISDYAPRICSIRVPVDKIGDVIGKGGATIRALTEETGVSIDIDDDGVVKIFAADGDAAKVAIERVEKLVEEIEVGRVYEGKVIKIVDFGAFVNILPGKDGLLHISQIAEERVENVGDYLKEGQDLSVLVLDVDRQGRVKLSLKGVDTAKSGSEQVPVEESAEAK